MKKRRSCLEILFDVLKYTNERSRITSIARGSNLSVNCLNDYIIIMKDHGIVSKKGLDISLTDKGKRLLWVLNE